MISLSAEDSKVPTMAGESSAMEFTVTSVVVEAAITTTVPEVLERP